MRNLRHRYTYEQRDEFQTTISRLAKYIVPVLLDKQGHVCNLRKQESAKYDIDHKLYNPMQNIDSLQLLCVPCHKSITNYTRIDYR